MAKYTTPDFDVTLYEIEDRITAPQTGSGDPDSDDLSFVGPGLNPQE